MNKSDLPFVLPLRSDRSGLGYGQHQEPSVATCACFVAIDDVRRTGNANVMHLFANLSTAVAAVRFHSYLKWSRVDDLPFRKCTSTALVTATPGIFRNGSRLPKHEVYAILQDVCNDSHAARPDGSVTLVGHAVHSECLFCRLQ